MLSFSLITPSIQRQSLIHCCQSINEQSYSNWEHFVCFDGRSIDVDLMHQIEHPQRKLFVTDETHNFGNHQRWFVWPYATKDFLLGVDDDNYLADERILEDIAVALTTSGLPDWACFPINRFGYHFFNAEPRSCHADTANIVVKREYGRWPDRPEYTADGFWMEGLRDHQPPLTFAAFPDFRPIIVMPQQGKGEL